MPGRFRKTPKIPEVPKSLTERQKHDITPEEERFSSLVGEQNVPRREHPTINLETGEVLEYTDKARSRSGKRYDVSAYNFESRPGGWEIFYREEGAPPEHEGAYGAPFNPFFPPGTEEEKYDSPEQAIQAIQAARKRIQERED